MYWRPGQARWRRRVQHVPACVSFRQKIERRMSKKFVRTLLLLSVISLSLSGNKASADALATALGATGAQGLFCNYMAIAELADLYGGKSYDKKKTNELAAMYGKLTETAKDSLTDLIDSGKLDKDDTVAVQQMVVINGLLSKMAGGIEEFVADPSKENEAAYEKNRQKAWNALSKFLGLEDK